MTGVGDSFIFTSIQIYSAWETDEVIARELWRNLGLAMAAVFVVTFVLLVDFRVPLTFIPILIIVWPFYHDGDLPTRS